MVVPCQHWNFTQEVEAYRVLCWQVFPIFERLVKLVVADLPRGGGDGIAGTDDDVGGIHCGRHLCVKTPHKRWCDRQGVEGDRKSFRGGPCAVTAESQACGDWRRNPVFCVVVICRHLVSMFSFRSLDFHGDAQVAQAGITKLSSSKWSILCCCQWTGSTGYTIQNLSKHKETLSFT